MPFDPYTKSVLHFDGVNQSQVFTDELGNVWSAAGTSGTSQLDTAEKVFGSASLRNPGTYNYISTPFNAAFFPGTGNFTIDFRFRFYTTPGGNNPFCQIGTYPYEIAIYSSTVNLYVKIFSASYSFAWAASASTWYHVAVTRQAGTLRAWVNGTQIGTDQSNSTNITYTSGTTWIGHTYYTSDNDANGWFDEFRLSNGIARWSTTFTPPFYEYGGSIFTSTSSIIVPTVTNLITVTAEKFYSLGSLVIPTIYNEAWTADAANDLPALTCAATGRDSMAALRADLPALTIQATGQTGEVGRVSAYLPGLRIAATGLTGEVGNLDLSLPFLTITSSGGLADSAVANLILPFFYINAHGETSPAQFIYKVLAMNLRNFAVSEYENFDFNSFGQINDVYLGAKADGIYPLVGKTDQGEDIDVSLTTGKAFIEHFRLRDLFSYGLTGGQKRSKIARGLHSGYVDFTIQNENGEDLDLDYFEVFGDPVRRKKH